MAKNANTDPHFQLISIGIHFVLRHLGAHLLCRMIVVTLLFVWLGIAFEHKEFLGPNFGIFFLAAGAKFFLDDDGRGERKRSRKLFVCNWILPYVALGPSPLPLPSHPWLDRVVPRAGIGSRCRNPSLQSLPHSRCRLSSSRVL